MVTPLLMYKRHDISYDVRSDIASVSNHVESVWVEVKLSPTLPCLISYMHRPPSSRIEYFNGMLDVLDKATAEEQIPNISITASRWTYCHWNFLFHSCGGQISWKNLGGNLLIHYVITIRQRPCKNALMKWPHPSY